ncbi:tRNA methyltransferase 10 homolog C-like [Clavelina lepadiformis]|uniref:tRNA methyltransferase 10 homolog C-like n=1 Tax=Clavelina lepadiformis TaxID=159417 RepID=UPI004043477B
MISPRNLLCCKSYQGFVASFHLSRGHDAKQHFNIFDVRRKKGTPKKTEKITGEGVDLLDQAQGEISPEKRDLARDINKIVQAMTRPRMHTENLNLKPKPLIDTCKITSPLAKLFIDPPDDPLDIFDHEIESWGDEKVQEMKRLYAYQFCLENEQPYKYELPEDVDQSNFLTDPDLRRKFLPESEPFNAKLMRFYMLKCALKNQKKRKTATKKRERGEVEDDGPTYGENFPNVILPRFGKGAISHVYSERMQSAKKFNQPLVVDMRFHTKWNREGTSLYSQLRMMLGENRVSRFPFHMVLCNYDEESPLAQEMRIDANSMLFNTCTTTNKSYLEMQPLIDRESLVYLSPNAHRTMTEFSHNKIYIFGGLIDLKAQTNLSKTICETENIRCEKFPLGQYLDWGGVGGKQELTVDVCMRVLLALKAGGNWVDAFRHIPYRLHRGLTEMGKDLAKQDPNTIEYFDRGRHWLESLNREKSSPATDTAFVRFQKFLDAN